MRVTPDAQFFTTLSGDMGARRRPSDAVGFARQAAINDAYGRTPPTSKQAKSSDKDTGSATDNAPPRREAPLAGQRPRFVPKGQTINILV